MNNLGTMLNQIVKNVNAKAAFVLDYKNLKIIQTTKDINPNDHYYNSIILNTGLFKSQMQIANGMNSSLKFKNVAITTNLEQHVIFIIQNSSSDQDVFLYLTFDRNKNISNVTRQVESLSSVPFFA
jgi:5'(3')-deoxyribonucleotidase